MRSALGIVGFTASAVIVAIAGRFGFATSGEPLDGIMWAFFYGLLALGAIGGPAVAVRVGRVAPVWGVIAGFFVCAVIAGNISVTFGASVGRSDRMLAERMRASQAGQFDAAELQRVQRERAEMKYTPATAADVKAAQETVAAAERSRIAECDKRGPHCRTREATEQSARETLTAALANKAATDKATRLDAEITTIRARINGGQAVVSVNPQAEAWARVFRVDPITAATYQPLAIVVLVEMLTAFTLLAWELLRPMRPPTERPLPVAQVKGAAQLKRKSTPVADSKPTTVLDVLCEIVAPTDRRKRVEIEDVHRAYVAACKAQEIEVASLEVFGAQAKEFVDAAGIRTLASEGKLYWCGARLEVPGRSQSERSAACTAGHLQARAHDRRARPIAQANGCHQEAAAGREQAPGRTGARGTGTEGAHCASGRTAER